MTNRPQHVEEYYDRKVAVFNPNNIPVYDLPIILGFNNGGSPGWYIAQLICEDGHGIGSHICSDEYYMYGDLGILEGYRDDRHETFKEHYPDGYRMCFMTFAEAKVSEFLDELVKRNQALAAAATDAAPAPVDAAAPEASIAPEEARDE